MYIETSSPRKPGENAKISRLVTLSGKSCLKFYYHMYGGHMGELKVKLCDRVIFNKSGNQGNQWNMLQLHLQGTGSKEVRTRFNWHSIQRHIIVKNVQIPLSRLHCYFFDRVKFLSKAHSIPAKHYSQLLRCGHLAITDTRLLRTTAKSPAKVKDWLK